MRWCRFGALRNRGHHTDFLDERIAALLRTHSGADVNWLCYFSSGFARRGEKLFAVAAEVAAALR